MIKSAVALTLANHGATLIIDAIDPVGTLDERVYSAIGEVFSELSPYEKYISGVPREDIGLYYSLKSKFNPRNEKETNYLGVTNTSRSFIERSVPYGIVGSYRDISAHNIVIAPMLTDEDEYDVSRLVDYVRGGGCLYFSGGDCRELLSAFFSATVVGRTRETVTYMSPTESASEIFGRYNEKYPLSFSASAPIIEGADGETLAKVTLPYTHQSEKKFASIHSNPPGKKTDNAAILYKEFGRGRVIWSALPIECYELYDYKNLLLRILGEKFGYTPTLTSNAPRDIEIALYDCEDGVFVNAVLLNDEEFAKRTEDFSLSVKCKKTPRRVISLPSEEEISADIDGDTVTLDVKGLSIYGVYKIEY
jgi:hypothetical protein